MPAMYPWMDINIPGSLANNTLIAGVVIVITAPLLITIYVYCRRTRAKHLREEEVGRMWINEAQYEEPEIRVPSPVHTQENHCSQAHFLKPGEYIEFNHFASARPRPYLSPISGSLRRSSRDVSPSRSTGSSLEIEQEGRVWYSRPVGGDYDDEDIDSQGRVRWQAFESRGSDEESSVAGRSFVTAPEH